MSGRTLLIGDIHGCDVALDVLLGGVAPTRDDTVVVLGDVIDRGPNTRRAIDLLLELREHCDLKFLLGNHEEMLLDSLQIGVIDSRWYNNGGQEMLESYGGDSLDAISKKHIEFLAGGLDFWENASSIFVHANLQPGVPLDRQDRQWLRWNRFTGAEPPHESGRRVFCGHTPMKNGLPGVYNGWVDVDTWAYRGMYLTCIDVDSEEVFQSQQTGTFRSGLHLDELR